MTHEDPVASVLLGLIVLFFSAKVGGLITNRWRQPAVLGELLAGVLISNLHHFGFDHFRFIATSPIFEVFASLGVIFLLFEVGLESKLQDLMRVGPMALAVAVVGVVAPMALGIGVNASFFPEQSFYTHLFVGAVLSATSVGITARVLKDLGKLHTNEAKVILGAAVIDDVLGLIVLAIVAGLITFAANSGGGESMSWVAVGWIVIKSVGFLTLALALGTKLAPKLFRFAGSLRVDGMLVSVSLIFCFALSYLAHYVGLAPIVGAFAAGLVIDGTGFARFFPDQDGSLEDLIFPISKFFVPIFFVHMGMKVDLSTLMDPHALAFGLVLTLAAIVGKQVCGGMVWQAKKKRISRLVVGIGMVPRGEVGLIFAMMGSQLILNGKPVIDGGHYSAILMMVFLTTLMTPPALKWALSKNG